MLIIVIFVGTLITQAQTKTIAYKELPSSTGASSGSGMFFGATMTSDSITVTFAGPSTKWIGLGFGTSMSGTDALIYTSSGGSQNWWDYYMGNTSSSSVVKDASQDWNIKSNTVVGTLRTVVATRKLNTGDSKDAVFNYNSSSINLVWARSSGTSYVLADHGGSRAYGITLTWAIPDVTPPTLVSETPSNNAVGVSKNQNLTATFSENIALGTGTITLYASNNSVVETYNLPSANVTLNAATITIQPTNVLSDSTNYYVLISSTAIKDLAGNYFSGIVKSTDWNFTTAAAVKQSAGLQEIAENQYVKITNSTIYISTNESSYNYQIIDLQGNIVKEKNAVVSDALITISDLKPAMYILKINNKEQLIQRKFVVQ